MSNTEIQDLSRCYGAAFTPGGSHGPASNCTSSTAIPDASEALSANANLMINGGLFGGEGLPGLLVGGSGYFTKGIWATDDLKHMLHIGAKAGVDMASPFGDGRTEMFSYIGPMLEWGGRVWEDEIHRLIFMPAYVLLYTPRNGGSVDHGWMFSVGLLYHIDDSRIDHGPEVRFYHFPYADHSYFFTLGYGMELF